MSYRHCTKNEIVVAIPGMSLQTIADIAAHEVFHRAHEAVAYDEREERAAGRYGT